MPGIYMDTLPLGFKHKQRVNRAKSWSQSDIHFFDLPSVTLRYRFVESNSNRKQLPTLVIIPDPPVMIEHYATLVESLRNHCNVLLFEMPGFGFSLPKRNFKMNSDDLNEIYAIFLKTIDKRPYILNFPCLSGLSATYLIHNHPDLACGLILTQTATKAHSMNWRKTVDPKNILGTPVLGQLLLRSQRKNMTRGWFKAVLHKKELLNPYSDICNDAYNHGACFCLASGLQGLVTPKLPEHEPVDTPALVIWGMHDKTHRKTIKQDTLKLAKEAQMEEFKQSAHFPDLEEPDKFTESVARFIAQI